jgi:hypothetical protein
MILRAPHLLTKLEVWFPRYHDQYEDGKERVVLLAKYKVDAASPVIIVEFTKAKHLIGQRYCIPKKEAQSFSLDSNGKIPCYVVPMSRLYTFNQVDEIKEIVATLFPQKEVL